MKKEEIIEIQKNLIEIYEKEFRKAGVKYPDDYQTTFIGKKIIKLKSELAELSGQEDKISDEVNEPSYSKGEINPYLLSKDEVDETIKKRNQGFK